MSQAEDKVAKIQRVVQSYQAKKEQGYLINRLHEGWVNVFIPYSQLFN